eukprot:15439305-Alexandrium_andersonii.AAC.1
MHGLVLEVAIPQACELAPALCHESFHACPPAWHQQGSYANLSVPPRLELGKRTTGTTMSDFSEEPAPPPQ